MNIQGGARVGLGGTRSKAAAAVQRLPGEEDGENLVRRSKATGSPSSVDESESGFIQRTNCKT